jgi:ubiquinol-cytochrome c reductase cytochrome b subunit
MFKKFNFAEFRQKLMKALDNRVKIITAGLNLNELRLLARGEPPQEKPNPRYKVHTTSFLFHIRPRYYEKGSTIFTHTFRLGFFTSLFFFIETITGLILMVYYTPSPDQAYLSIQNLLSNVPFGQLLRNIHRIGAEGMVIFTVLHMLRTFLTGSYKKERSFTWLTGMVLLLSTLLLSFSGYLLPWDQLAYWAVTIGTSMVEAGPLVGPQINLLLRGSPDIAANGLLRFYLLHVVLVPFVVVLVLSIHYYKVSREHGISLPAKFEEGNATADQKKVAKQRIDFLPDLLTHEMFLTALALFILVVLVLLRYPVPLENVANPQQTPLDTMAPWYFLWLQGMLKIDPAKIIEDALAPIGIVVELNRYLDSKQIMGIVFPTLIFGVLFAVPYIDRNPHRSMAKRPWAVAIGLLVVLVLVALSYMGLPGYGIETDAATRILQDMAPEEVGPLREVPFDELVPGVYEVGITNPDDMCEDMDFGCPALKSVFVEYSERVGEAEADGRLPAVQAVMVIEDWQVDLRKITPRLIWQDPESGDTKTYEKHIFLHRNRGGH